MRVGKPWGSWVILILAAGYGLQLFAPKVPTE